MKAKERNKIDQTCLIALFGTFKDALGEFTDGTNNHKDLSKKEARAIVKLVIEMVNDISLIMATADRNEDNSLDLGNFDDLSIKKIKDALGMETVKCDHCEDEDQLNKYEKSDEDKIEEVKNLVNVLEVLVKAKKATK